MFCTNCGKEIDEECNCCKHCGCEIKPQKGFISISGLICAILIIYTIIWAIHTNATAYNFETLNSDFFY